LTPGGIKGKINLVMHMPVITLTTDFGQRDAYVGAMKGVILSINPQATLVDLSHEITPQAVEEAAYVLWTAYPYFPPATVHVVVVDPGVGSARRPIAIQTERAFFVGPDNGVFSYVLAAEGAASAESAAQGKPQVVRQRRTLAVHLTNPRYWRPQVSRTFHGRDIFAPVAAHLSLGVPIGELGEPIEDVVILPLARPESQGDQVVGRVVHVDHFGNVITNLEPAHLPAGQALVIQVGGHRIQGLSPTYSAARPGELVALWGSDGLLEIAVREGNAGALLGIRVGDEVTVAALKEETTGLLQGT